MANPVQRRALRDGARIMGSEARLCDMLGAPPDAYARWLDGAEPIPEPAYAMLLQFLSDMESETPLPH